MSNVYWPLYEVFVRSKQGLSHRHVGSLHAADDRMALENARDAYTRRGRERGVFRSGGKQGLPPSDVLHHP
ncbi:Phenylacetate-CoA oxygenase%2C PaaH subunit [Enterobacter cloacae]|nr:Phenylacetate-CoA oxygenase%2C PaaH subunit [Enterobacter cloacae]